jgi:hypothetical protein
MRGSVLLWGVGPGLAPARPSRDGGGRPYIELGQYRQAKRTNSQWAAGGEPKPDA